jgi:hypothetical protein
MSLYGRSSRWAAALALGLAGLIGVGAAMVLAAPARTAASTFELTLEGRQTLSFEDEVVYIESRGTFRSSAPFCATGTFVDEWGTLRFTCDDGTGSLTVSVPSLTPWGDTTWRILWGSGSYAGLHGRGSEHGSSGCSSTPRIRSGTCSSSGVRWAPSLRGGVGSDPWSRGSEPGSKGRLSGGRE